jgi:hypothetical protein
MAVGFSGSCTHVVPCITWQCYKAIVQSCRLRALRLETFVEKFIRSAVPSSLSSHDGRDPNSTHNPAYAQSDQIGDYEYRCIVVVSV